MQKKIKILIIASVGVAAALTVIISAYSRETKVKALNVIFESGNANSFIVESDIINIVERKYPDYKTMGIHNINTRELELMIDSFPQVKKADVYTKYTGELNIKIRQRHPLFRVFNKFGESYYVDTEGRTIPVSEKKSAHVLVVNGNIPEPFSGKRTDIFSDSLKILDKIHQIVKIINDDAFLNAQIGQLHISEKAEIELVPLIGYHIVNLGDTSSDFKTKLRHLKYFYTEGLPKSEWNDYKYISLKYRNQIVCTKNP